MSNIQILPVVQPYCRTTSNLYGTTALMWTAVYGRVDCLKILLDSKADPKVKDVHERTSLDWAACYDNPKCLKLLQQHLSEDSTL